MGELCIIIGSIGQARPISLISRVVSSRSRPIIGPQTPPFCRLCGDSDRPARPRDQFGHFHHRIGRQSYRGTPLGSAIHLQANRLDGSSTLAHRRSRQSVARHRLLAATPGSRSSLPFVVYMIVGSVRARRRPKPASIAAPTARPRTGRSTNNWFGLEYQHYPIVYTVKIALTIAAMLFVLPGYRQFPFRISLLAIVVGVVGVVLWICALPPAPRTQAPRPARPRHLPRPRRPPRVQPARTTRRHAGLGLHVPGHPLPRPRAHRADHRRVLPPRLPDAVRHPRRLVGRPVRHADAARGRRRHRRPDADAPRRAAGRRSSGSAWSPG